ncbi:hypothetical protein BJX99DRAFT_253064 [Aspergillus californicus]
MEKEIPHQVFQETICVAAQQKAILYEKSHYLSIRWEGDGATAHQDTVRDFQRILPKPAAQEELVLMKEDKTPGSTVKHKFYRLLANATKPSNRVLVIVHYAGHSFIDNKGRLRFAERLTNGRDFDAKHYLTSLVRSTEYGLCNATNVDVLFIFDCS